MAGDSQSLVKSVSHLPTKIDVVKFEARTISKCEDVGDGYPDGNLEDSLHLEEKPVEISEKD